MDVQTHVSTERDVRREGEREAHVLALNRLERIADAGGAPAGGSTRGVCRVRTGEERHFFRNFYHRLLIVEGHHRRRGKDVVVAIALQRRNKRAERKQLRTV